MLGIKKKKENNPDLDDTQVIRDILESTQKNIQKALELLDQGTINNAELTAVLQSAQDSASGNIQTTPTTQDPQAGNVVEGVFNGIKMISADGHEYQVPANYASKSKLVEGDILKLTIANNGSFIYKQIGPIERKQMVGMLVRNESTAEWFAMADGKRWKLLTAAVTYYHGEPGDEVVILIPQKSQSQWAAVENIIKKAQV